MLHREHIHYSRDLAIAQAAIDPKAAIERFEDYSKAMFPWLSSSKLEEAKEHMKILQAEISKGPLQVTAIGAGERKKKNVEVRPRSVVKPQPLDAEGRRRQNEFYKKVGSAL